MRDNFAIVQIKVRVSYRDNDDFFFLVNLIRTNILSNFLTQINMEAIDNYIMTAM